MVGRFFSPALGRPLQPHSAAAPPTIPQALNRYAATAVGQPGVADVEQNNYITQKALATGFAKSLSFELAADATWGSFGRLVTTAFATRSIRPTGAILALKGSASFIERSRGLVEAAGGQIVNTRLRVQGSSIRQATVQFAFDSGDLAADVAVQLRRQSRWAQAGDGVGVWSNITYVDNVTTTSNRVARFSWLADTRIGFGTDFGLGFGFQLWEDSYNPYFTPQQRLARAGVSGGGGAITSLLGGAAGAIICGSTAPICIAGGGLVGSVAWAYGVQPLVFNNIPFLQAPSRNLKILR